MSTQYESIRPATVYPEAFRVAAPEQPIGLQVWPRQPGVFIRHAAVPAGAESEGLGDNPTEEGQRCIVPVMAFIEEDWRSGKAVPTRIARVDGKPMGIAGLWERWTGADGEVITSFCLLTLNANTHALISRYQQPGNEKRMPAILNEGGFDAWLGARPEKAREFVRAYPANWLLANPVQKGGRGREW
jgi:hypothetical protein